MRLRITTGISKMSVSIGIVRDPGPHSCIFLTLIKSIGLSVDRAMKEWKHPTLSIYLDLTHASLVPM
jgi:hypothetical protein